MKPWLRKLGITVHVALSMGWLGGIAAFLALAIVALGHDPVLSRSAFIAMRVVGIGVLVPLSVGALLSGLVQSLGTKWGLVRNYWVLVKLVLTLVATAVLLLHQFTAINEAATLAAQASSSLRSATLHQLGVQLLADASAAIVVLLAIAAIAVYKPWGRTGFGQRERAVVLPAAARAVDGNKPWSLRVFVAAIVAFVVAFIVLHVSGRGLHHNHAH